MSVHGEFDRSLTNLLGFLRESGERVRASKREPDSIARATAAIEQLRRELEKARVAQAGDLSASAELALAAVSPGSKGPELQLADPEATRYAALAEHLVFVSCALLGRPAPPSAPRPLPPT